MTHPWRRWGVVALALTVALAALPGGAPPRAVIARQAAPTASPSREELDTILAARLGGTRQSFEAAYGVPIAESPDGPRYAVPGGVVDVQYQPRRDPAPSDRALILKLRPDRAAARPVTAPDPADWSLLTAEDLARRFLPADATLGAVAAAGEHRLAAACRSAALAALFPDSPAPGACQVGFTTPTARTVSFITITLGAGAATPPATPADPCLGSVGWARATAARLDAARHLLDTVSHLSGDDAAAAARLREVARQFAALRDAQRATAAPTAAAAANARLVAIFEQYRGALALAADSVATPNATVANRAAGQLTAANAAVGQADALMRAAFRQCDLTPATPTP